MGTTNFYDGVTIPEADLSFDAVSIMNVLHHAADSTPGLLRQVAAIARTWILITEDLDAPEFRKRNLRHDPRGIFRSDREWRTLFATECKGFALARSGFCHD